MRIPLTKTRKQKVKEHQATHHYMCSMHSDKVCCHWSHQISTKEEHRETQQRHNATRQNLDLGIQEALSSELFLGGGYL